MLEASFFGLRMIIISNSLLSVAVLCPVREELHHVQVLITRYFYSQLWAEFSIEVLTEFNNEDSKVYKHVVRVYEANEFLKLEAKIAAKRGHA